MINDIAQALPILRRDEIHVWIVPVIARGPADVNGIEALAPTERVRASLFRSEVDGACFMERRAALRTILARYLEIAPRDVEFTVDEFGKPSVIVPDGSAELSFNASHSGTVAAIAITRLGRIGIDIERLRPLPEAESIAARFFTANEAVALAALSSEDRVNGFFNAWTRKEAVVKALGAGLSIRLDSFEVSLRPREPPAILRSDIPDADPKRWTLHQLEPAAGYVGALAVDREVSVCQCSRWPT